MATDPFANIGFRENFSQAYYTEVIIARNKKSVRFASSTPTVTNSYRHLMSGNVYRVAELLSITGPKQPIAIENKVQYKRDQPYSLYYQNQIGDEFRIQNVDPNLTAEGRGSYWARVSAPLGPEWIQYYAGNDAKIGYIINIIDRNMDDFTGTNFSGFISGKLNNDPTKPNLYDEIQVSRVGNTGLRAGQTATISLEPGFNKSFLSCKVTEGTRFFDSFGQEIIPGPLAGGGDLFASEFSLNFYIFPGYHTFYYGTWKIVIEPTNTTGAHKVRITQGRYPAASGGGTYGDNRLTATIDCSFQWDGSLSKFNLITMKYLFTPSAQINVSLYNLTIFNICKFSLFVNTTQVYNQSNGNMWPPSVYSSGFGDVPSTGSMTQSDPIGFTLKNVTPPRDKAFLVWTTPVAFEIGKSDVAFVLITDKLLDLNGLYTHLIRYERPMASLEIETNPENGGVAPPGGGGGIVSKYYNRATFSIAPETLVQVKKVLLDFMLGQPNYQSTTLATDPILAKMLADTSTVTTFSLDIEEQSKNKNIIDLLREPITLTVDGSPAFDLDYGINSNSKLRARIVETTTLPQHVVTSETELYGTATYIIKTSLTDNWHSGTVTMTAKFKILVDDNGIYDPKLDPYINKNPNEFTLNEFGVLSIDSMITDWSFTQGADGGNEIIPPPPGKSFFVGSWSWAPLLGQIDQAVRPLFEDDYVLVTSSVGGFKSYNEKLYSRKPGSTGTKRSDWELAQFPIGTDSILYDVERLDSYPFQVGDLSYLKRSFGTISNGDIYYTTRGTNDITRSNFNVNVQYTIRDVTILSEFIQDSPVNVTMDVTLTGKPASGPNLGRTKPFSGVKLTFIFPVKVVLELPPQALSAPEETPVTPEEIFSPQAIPDDFYTKYENHRAVPITTYTEVTQLFSDALPDGLPVKFNMSNKTGTGGGGVNPLPPGPGTPTKYYNRAEWNILPNKLTQIEAFLKDFMTSRDVIKSTGDTFYNIVQTALLTDSSVTKTFTSSVGYGENVFDIVNTPRVVGQEVVINYSAAFNTPEQPPSENSALRLEAKIPLNDSNRAYSTIILISTAKYTFAVPDNFNNPNGDLSSYGAGTIEVSLDFSILNADAATLPNGGNFNPYIVGNTNEFEISSAYKIDALNASVKLIFENGDIVTDFGINPIPIYNLNNNPIKTTLITDGIPIYLNMSNIEGTDGAVVPGGTPPPATGTPLSPNKKYTATFTLAQQPFKAFEEDSLQGLFNRYHNRDNINYTLYDQILNEYTQAVTASRLAADVFKEALIERSKIPGNPSQFQGYLQGITAYFNDAACVLLNNGLNGANLFSPPGKSCEVLILNYKINPDIQIVGGIQVAKNTKLTLGSNIIKMGVTVELTCNGGSNCVVVAEPSGPALRPKIGGVPTKSISYEFDMEIIVTENTSGVTPPTAPTIRVSYALVGPNASDFGGLIGALAMKYSLSVSAYRPITMLSGGVYSKDILYNEASMKLGTTYYVKAFGTDSLLYENGNIAPVKLFLRGERQWSHDSNDPTNDYTLIDFYITAYIDTRYTKALNGSLVSDLDSPNTTRAAIYYMIEPVTVPFPRSDGTIVPSKKLPLYSYFDYTNVLLTKLGFTPVGGGNNPSDPTTKYVGKWNLQNLIPIIEKVYLAGGYTVKSIIDLYRANLNSGMSTLSFDKILFEIGSVEQFGRAVWLFAGDLNRPIKSKSIQYWMESQSKYANVENNVSGNKPYGYPIKLVYIGTDTNRRTVTLTISADIEVRDVTLTIGSTTSVTLDVHNVNILTQTGSGPDIVDYSGYGNESCAVAVEVYEQPQIQALNAPEEMLMLPQAVPSDFEWSPPKYITVKSDSLKYFDGKNNVSYFRNGYIEEAAQTYSFIGTRTSQNDLIATYRHGDFSSYDSATTNYDVVVGGFELVYHRGTNDTLTLLPVEIVEPNTKKKFVCFGSTREVGNIINSSIKSNVVMTFITDYGSTSDKNGEYWVYDESWKEWAYKIPINTGDELNLNCYTCAANQTGTLATNINLITKFNTNPTPNNPPPYVDPSQIRAAEFSYEQIAKKPYTLPVVYPPGFPNPSTYHFAFPKKLSARPKSLFNTSPTEYEFYLASVDNTQRNATYQSYSWKNNELIIGGFTVTYTPHESFRLSKLDIYSADLDRDFECFGLSRFVYDNSGNLIAADKWQFVPTYEDPNDFANWYLTVVQDPATGGNYFNTYCNEGGGKWPDWTKRSCADNNFFFVMQLDASFNHYTPPAPVAIAAPVPTGPPVQLPIYSTGFNATTGLPITFSAERDNNWEITKFISGPEKTPTHYWKFNDDLSDSAGNLPFVAYPARTFEGPRNPWNYVRPRDADTADFVFKEGVVWSNNQTQVTPRNALFPINAGLFDGTLSQPTNFVYYGKGREYGVSAYVASEASNRLIDSDAWTITCWYKIPVEPIANQNPLYEGVLLGITPYTLNPIYKPDVPSTYTFGPQLITDSATRITVFVSYMWQDVPTFPDYTIPIKSGHIRLYFRQGRSESYNAVSSAKLSKNGGTPVYLVDENGNGIFRSYITGEVVPESDQYARPVNFLDIAPVDGSLGPDGLRKNIWSFMSMKKAAGVNDRLVINIGGKDYTAIFPSSIVTDQLLNKINYIEPKVPIDDLRIYDDELTAPELQLISRINSTGGSIVPREYIPGGTVTGIVTNYVYAYDHFNSSEAIKPYWWPAGYTSGSTIVPDRTNLYQQYNARWVSPPPKLSIDASPVSRTYNYTTKVDLAGISLSTVKISFFCSGDDRIIDIVINGTSTGFNNISEVGGLPANNSTAYDNLRYRNLWDVKLPSGENHLYVQKINTIDIIVENQAVTDPAITSNPIGLYVYVYEKTGVPLPIIADPDAITIDISDTGYNKIAGQPISIGAMDNNWVIEKVVRTEIVPTHYWRFNNDLNDLTGALNFLPYSPVQHKFAIGTVVGYAGNIQNVGSVQNAVYPNISGMPAAEFGKHIYVESQTSDILKVAKTQSWTMTGWIKIPQQLSGQLDFAELFTASAFNKTEIDVPNPSKRGLTLVLRHSYTTNPKFPPPYSGSSFPLYAGSLYMQAFNGFDTGAVPRRPVNMSNLNGTLLYRDYLGTVRTGAETEAAGINIGDTRPFNTIETKQFGFGVGSWVFFAIKITDGIKVSGSNWKQISVTINGQEQKYLFDGGLDTTINYIDFSCPVDDLRVYDGQTLPESEIKFISKYDNTKIITGENDHTTAVGVPREYGAPFLTWPSPAYAYDYANTYSPAQPYWWPQAVPNQASLYGEYKARWISPPSSTGINRHKLDSTGFYYYKTTFNLANIDIETVKISLLCTGDDQIADIIVNGKSTGLSNISEVGGIPGSSSAYENSRFRNLWDVKLPRGKDHLYTQLTNTLTIVIQNKNLEDTIAISNPSGLYVHFYEKTGLKFPTAEIIDPLYFTIKQETYTPTVPPVIPPIDPIVLPKPVLRPIDGPTRSSKCLELSAFSYFALGPVNSGKVAGTATTPAFNRKSTIWAFAETSSPNTFGQNRHRYGFSTSSAVWVKEAGGNSCKLQLNCVDTTSATMAKNNVIYRLITAPADSWITISWRQVTPLPGFRLSSDNNGIKVATVIRSATGKDHIRVMTDVQSIFGMPTKRVIPPCYSAVEEYNYSQEPVDIQILIYSMGTLYENFVDDIVIEYGPGYCNEIVCIDTFTGSDPILKYVGMTRETITKDSTEAKLIQYGPAELNFGSKYYINAGSTASQTIELGGYLNKGAKLSVSISGYSETKTNGVVLIVETYDENFEPLEQFTENLGRTQPGSFYSTDTFDNASEVNLLTVSTFILGQAARIIKVFVTSQLSKLAVGFIDVCSDQDVTFLKTPPALECKGNVNKLRVIMNVNGVPREEVNIFQAFCRYSVLTNTHYRTQTILETTPSADGRTGTALPIRCDDAALCNYWKQQGFNNTVQQKILTRTIIDNKVAVDISKIKSGSYNNLTGIDNWIWASPLNKGFGPDQYILQFPQTPNKIAEDNFVESLEILLSVNTVQVENADCLSAIGSAYKFADHITVSSDSAILPTSIPKLNVENPTTLRFDRVSLTVANKVTTANYVLARRTCSDKYVFMGGFSIEHHPENGSYFTLKPYDWSKSPNSLLGVVDNCRSILDYSTLYTFGAITTANNLAVNDRTRTTFFFKPNGSYPSKGPVSPQFFELTIQQSSQYDMFSASSSTNSVPVRLVIDQTPLKTTVGPEVSAFFTWDSAAELSVTDYTGGSECKDPADTISVTIEYTNAVGTMKRFTKEISLADANVIDTVNSEDWNALGAFGNGLKGDYATWVSAKFDLDLPYGGGLDQCLAPIVDPPPPPPPVYPTVTGEATNLFSILTFENSIKGMYIPFCTPEVLVAEAIQGASQNEIQSMVIPVSTGGFYTLTFDFNGSYSVEVPYNADAAGLRASLAGLPNIGSTNNITVSGSGSANAPFIIEFTGDLAITELPLLIGDTTSLGSVASGTVIVVTTGSTSERQRIINTASTRSPLVLSFDSYITGNIQFNASLNEFQTALSLVPSLGAEVSVTGNIVDRDSAFTGPYNVDFIGNLAGQSQPTLTPLVAGYTQELMWSGVNGVNTKQLIRISATSGTFTITIFDTVNNVQLSATTAPISYNASETDIANAIAAAASFITVADMVVTKLPATGDATLYEWTVEFVENFANVPVQKLVLNTGLLVKQDQIIIARTQTGLSVGEKQRMSLKYVTGGYYYLQITVGVTTLTTAAIPYDATDIRVEQEISALDFFSTGDVSVRRDPLLPEEYKAYIISFRSSFGNMPMVVPVFQDLLICDPYLQMPGGPYDYKVPICAVDPLSLSGVQDFCYPGPNDGVSPLPDCCDLSKTGDNTIDVIQYQRELFNPDTRLYGKVVTVRQLAAMKRIIEKDFSVYSRDFTTNTLTPVSYDTTIRSGLSLLFVEKTVDTSAGLGQIVGHLSSSQELLPTRVLWNLK